VIPEERRRRILDLPGDDAAFLTANEPREVTRVVLP
jgi:hypothetical protein